MHSFRKLFLILTWAVATWVGLPGCGKGLDTTFVVVKPTLEVKDSLTLWYRAETFAANYNYGSTITTGWASTENRGQTLSLASGAPTLNPHWAFGFQSPFNYFVYVTGSDSFSVAAPGVGSSINSFSMYVSGRMTSNNGGAVGLSSSALFDCSTLINQVSLFIVGGVWRADMCNSASATATMATIDGTSASANYSRKVFRIRWNSTDRLVRLLVSGFPEAQAATASAGTGSISLNGIMKMGAISPMSPTAGMEIDEVLFYETTLSDADDQAVLDYLKNSYPTQ